MQERRYLSDPAFQLEMQMSNPLAEIQQDRV